jgi:hypothetical protein
VSPSSSYQKKDGAPRSQAREGGFCARVGFVARGLEERMQAREVTHQQGAVTIGGKSILLSPVRWWSGIHMS